MKNKKLLHLSICLLTSAMPQLQAAPVTEGQWSEQVDWPMIAIHTVMTPKGDLFTWGTDSEGIQGAQFLYDLWSPDKGTSGDSHNTLTSTLGVDSFCSAGLVLAESGSVLMSGGDARPDGAVNFGVDSTVTFNTQTNTLSSVADMASARWYPTSITLSNGEVLVSGGKDGAGIPVVTPEIYSPDNNTWRSLLGIQTTDYEYAYPRLWVIPDGRIFGTVGKKMFYMQTAGIGSLLGAAELPNIAMGVTSTAVMYRPGKIIQIGGLETINAHSAILIDVTGQQPVVRETTQLSQQGRSFSNSVVLPDGKVIVLGGSTVYNDLDTAAYQPEIWDPAAEQWSLMAASQRSRLYHSTAILMKDGRILAAGGGAPGPEVNTNAEIFSPPYLFNSDGLAPRPKIAIAPAEAGYGADITVTPYTDNQITRATLIKTGAVTHSLNMEQRFIELDFVNVANSLQITLPSSSTIATPGHYLLYLIDSKGVPSEGHIIKISANASYVETPSLIGNPDTATSSGEAITIDVLANDIGTNLLLDVPSAWSLQGGNVALLANKITYTPKSGFSGQDKIWYNFKDALGGESWGEVTINVLYQDEVSTGGGGAMSFLHFLMLFGLLALKPDPLNAHS